MTVDEREFRDSLEAINVHNMTDVTLILCQRYSFPDLDAVELVMAVRQRVAERTIHELARIRKEAGR